MEHKEKIELSTAIVNTFNCIHSDAHICPKCGKCMIIPGYICFGCGYDDSIDKE